MSHVVFGDAVPCRTCHGYGKVKHVQDEAQARERSRVLARARKLNLPPPLDAVPSMDPCPACDASGYVAPSVADR